MFNFLWRAPDTALADAFFGEAYACIEQGLCYDEVNDYDNTLVMYEKGLELIKEGEKQKHAKKSALYKNLMEAKNSVEHRIKVLKKEGPKKKEKVPIEVKDETTAVENNVKNAIREQLDSFGDREADLIYFLPEGVQLFTIDGSRTTAPTPPTSLQIFRLSNDDDSFAYEMNNSSAFIQVGPWVYPLLKHRTPVLCNEFGAYVVPNPTADSPNMMVAILLPADIEPRLVDEFRQVLKEYVDYREQDVGTLLTTDEKKRLSTKIASFLISTGEKIAWGVETTTVKVVSQMEDKGERYRATLEQTDKPVTISPAVRGSVVYMHKGTKVVAKCTRYLLDKIGDMGVTVGKKLADSAQKTFGEGKAGGFVSGTIEVLGGGITSVSTVWISLEDGSKNLCRNIANQTVQNVKLKYGDDASDTTHHALFAVGHGSLAAAQLWDLGPRSVAGRMARKAGIQMVTDLHGSRRAISGPDPLPPKKAL